MRLMHIVFSAVALLVVISVPALSATPPSVPSPSETWECPQADGSSVYTNKEKAGCRAMMLKPLSVVPSLDHMPTTPRAVVTDVPHYQVVPPADQSIDPRDRLVPGWARDWQASIAAGGFAQEEVCSMYSEWIHLVQKTRGGIFYGSDPSYGGDVSGRNQRGPSYSFYDNARYIALSRVFGTGFVPVGCP